MPSDEASFIFAPESPRDGNASTESVQLQVLMVDDDRQFQHSLQLALRDFRFHGYGVDFKTARSATEAATILTANPGIAVMLLDVVMETDDAGIRLVRAVREALGNAEIRIVLVTGQPGVSSLLNSLETLDISDYWLKTDLTQERLHGILNGSLRTWDQIRSINRARRGLQVIVEASNSIGRARSIRDFAERTIRELAGLLDLDPEGVVCVQDHLDPSPGLTVIVGAAGRLNKLVNEPLERLEDADIRELLMQSLDQQVNLGLPDKQVLFFDKTDSTPAAAIYLATGRALDETENELLRVFSTNIHSGLINVSLTSQLDRIAFEDGMLAIPNGNALCRSIEAVLDMPSPRQRTLLLIELDQYSKSCVSLGIEQGDLLLQEASTRLQTNFPSPCVIARLHDDVFGVLGPSEQLTSAHIDRLESADEMESPLPAFISLFAARVNLDDYHGSAREALAIGDLLLKRARAQGLRDIVDYQPGLERETDHLFGMSRRLRHALHNGEIRIEFQPKVDLASRAVVGAEALCRWTEPDGHSVSPVEFIAAAEGNGLIIPLGRRVIDLACQALTALNSAGFPNIPIAVNVSALQLGYRDFKSTLISAVQHYRIDPSQLELEITESALIGDYQGNLEVIRDLCKLGFQIAIDDFGTGYSSLAYLHQLPATSLKIDRSFISQIGHVGQSEKQISIAEMVLQLGRALGIQVVAEGVETDAQVAWLCEHGCRLAQGFYFARSEPLEAFIERLRSQT